MWVRLVPRFSQINHLARSFGHCERTRLAESTIEIATQEMRHISHAQHAQDRVRPEALVRTGSQHHRSLESSALCVAELPYPYILIQSKAAGAPTLRPSLQYGNRQSTMPDLSGRVCSCSASTQAGQWATSDRLGRKALTTAEMMVN